MYKPTKKVGKESASKKSFQGNYSIVPNKGSNSLSAMMCKRVAKEIDAVKPGQKFMSSKLKNKENNVYVTYKSLNQRVMDQNIEVNRPNSSTGHSVMKNPVLRTKMVQPINYRTKQNSPDRRVPSMDRNLVI